MISANHDLNDKTFARPLKAAALLDPLFVAYPQHPGVAHYLIHSYDYPPSRRRGWRRRSATPALRPMRRTPTICPPHIFTRVGFWRESVASNQASVAAKGDALYTLHGWDYMVYAYLHGQRCHGGEGEAEAQAHGTMDKVSFGAVFGAAAIPARLALEGGRWAEAATLCRRMSRPRPGSVPRRPSLLMPLPGRSGPRGAATPRCASGDRAAASPATGAHGAQAGLLGRADGASRPRSPAPGALLAEGKNEEALAAMRAAADHEDQTEKHAVTPGPIMPARELLGDMLLELGRPADALPQYEASIAKEPNRFRGLYGAGLAAERW